MLSTKNRNLLTMLVISLDADGCLLPTTPKKDVISGNKNLLDHLQTIIVLHDKSALFVGSNRQSKGADNYASRVLISDSFFPAIIKISNLLSVPLDPILMADIYAKKKPGETLCSALKNPEQIDTSQWLLDKKKISLLYMQIHKVASENHTESPITFNFYDDKEIILEDLLLFFTREKSLIPRNVTLKLYQYKHAEKVKLLESVKGEGKIDTDYRNTILKMAFLSTGALFFLQHDFIYDTNISINEIDFFKVTALNLKLVRMGPCRHH